MTIAELLKREGEKKGLEKGEQNGIARVAGTMIRKGVDWETIAEYTGLSLDELSLIAQKAS